MTSNVVSFARRAPDTYGAKAFHWSAGDLRVQTSGRLQGDLDLALFDAADGHMGTYVLTCDEARELAAKLLSVTEDIQKNCFFDRDALLIDERPAV